MLGLNLRTKLFNHIVYRVPAFFELCHNVEARGAFVILTCGKGHLAREETEYLFGIQADRAEHTGKASRVDFAGFEHDCDGVNRLGNGIADYRLIAETRNFQILGFFEKLGRAFNGNECDEVFRKYVFSVEYLDGFGGCLSGFRLDGLDKVHRSFTGRLFRRQRRFLYAHRRHLWLNYVRCQRRKNRTGLNVRCHDKHRNQ